MPSDSRYAFLRDPDLYDLVGRLARKRVRDEAFADDCRNGAYEVAMQLVRGGRGPKPGTERGWMCCVARNHTYAALRARKEEAKPVALEEEHELPVADQTTLLAEQMEVERQSGILEKLAAEHPEKVAEVLADDARAKKGQGEAKDSAARKRKERTRTTLASIFSAAVAAAIMLLWFRGPGAPKPALPAGGYATLADAQHDLAGYSCAAKQWTQCLDDLERLERLDASKMGPREHAARDAALAGLRQDALAACTKSDVMTCLEGLDVARKYDPAGESDPSVQLARSEAEKRLRGSAASPSPWIPDAKGIPPRR